MITDKHRSIVPLVRCDQCGLECTEYEMAETIEEYLCEQCASGMNYDGDPADFGFADAWDEAG